MFSLNKVKTPSTCVKRSDRFKCTATVHQQCCRIFQNNNSNQAYNKLMASSLYLNSFPYYIWSSICRLIRQSFAPLFSLCGSKKGKKIYGASQPACCLQYLKSITLCSHTSVTGFGGTEAVKTYVKGYCDPIYFRCLSFVCSHFARVLSSLDCIRFNFLPW